MLAVNEKPEAADVASHSGTAYGSATAQAEAERIERMALALSEQSPPWAAKYIAKVAPAIGAVGAGCEIVGPYLLTLGKTVYDAYRSLPSTAARGLWGLGICFFGGKYAVSIAAWEAFRSMGGSQVYMCLQDLKAQAAAVWDANTADDKKDVDEDGVEDVKQMGAQQLAVRKMALVLKTIDPETISRAVSGLWTAYIGVLTVLKFQFARTVACAESIGENLRPTMAKIIGPTVVAVTPPDYRKWISPSINILCKVIAGAIAWKIQQLASTVQSGFSGGLIASRALLELMRQRAIMSVADDQTCLDEVVGWTLGVCGIYTQLFRGGPLPYWLTPLFWPLDILENMLKWNVTWMNTLESRETASQK